MSRKAFDRVTHIAATANKSALTPSCVATVDAPLSKKLLTCFDSQHMAGNDNVVE